MILFLPISNRPSLMDFLTVTELVAKILPGFMKPPYAQAFTEVSFESEYPTYNAVLKHIFFETNKILFLIFFRILIFPIILE